MTSVTCFINTADVIFTVVKIYKVVQSHKSVVELIIIICLQKLTGCSVCMRI